MSEETIGAPKEMKGRIASAVAAIYFVGGLVISIYLAYLNPNRAPEYLLQFLAWGLPFGLLAVGFRRDPRGTVGWLLIVLGWILLLTNFSSCSSAISLRGQITTLEEEYRRKSDVIRREIDAALDESGWYEFPNPDQLHAASDFQQVRAMLVTVRDTYQSQEERSTELQKELLDAIRSLDGPQYKIDKYVNANIEFMNDNEALVRRLHDRNFERVIEAEKLVNVLAKTPRSWTVETGVLLFDNDEDIDNYNRHLDRMIELDWEFAQMQQSLQQMVDQ